MNTYENTLRKAAAWCSSGEHCVSELQHKLNAWGTATDEKEKVIDYLIKENFVNENRYAGSFVRDKFRFNKWGRIKIGYALRQKEIPEDIIASALNEIEEEEYIETLNSLLNSKLKSLKYDNSYDAQQKLARFASSRGFELNIIFSLIKKMMPYK